MLFYFYRYPDSWDNSTISAVTIDCQEFGNESLFWGVILKDHVSLLNPTCSSMQERLFHLEMLYSKSVDLLRIARYYIFLWSAPFCLDQHFLHFGLFHLSYVYQFLKLCLPYVCSTNSAICLCRTLRLDFLPFYDSHTSKFTWQRTSSSTRPTQARKVRHLGRFTHYIPCVCGARNCCSFLWHSECT